MSSDVIIAAKNGSPDAVNLVLQEYEPLVRFFARQRDNRLYYDDYIQVGLMGLFQAIKKTDPGIGGSFSSYAASYIKNEMALLSCKIQGLKWNDYLLLAKYYKNRREIEQREQREIDLQEVLDEMKLQPSQVDILKTYVRRTLVSIDVSELNPGERDSQIDVDVLEILKDGRIKFISEMIAELTEIQAYQVKRFYLDGVTQVQIAKEIGWTPASVGSKIRQIRIRLKQRWPHKLFQIAYDSEKFYDPDYSFHRERWKRIKGIDTVYMVSNYGRVRSYHRKENKFIIKYPNKDKESLRYRLNDSGRMVTIPTSKIIIDHFETDELPTFYES